MVHSLESGAIGDRPLRGPRDRGVGDTRTETPFFPALNTGSGGGGASVPLDTEEPQARSNPPRPGWEESNKEAQIQGIPWWSSG